jgi:hypothetical protein
MSKQHKTTKSGKKNGPVKVRPTVAELAELEKQGVPMGDHASGFRKGMVIHDHTTQRTITNAGRMPGVRGKNGKSIDFECFVKKRSSAGPTELVLSLRAIAPVLDRDSIIKVLSESPSLVANPEESLAVMRQLMEDGMITMDIIDDVLNYHHPAWSQLDWEIDEALEGDFVTGFMADPANAGKTEKDALEAFNALPNVLLRKEGDVTVTVQTDKGEREFSMHIACEKASLDRGRYFLALANGCSPFRTAWLKIHGFKNAPRQIEGRPSDHRTVGKLTPSFVKEEKSREAHTLGDAIKVANPEAGGDILAALKAGGTITL